MKKYRLEQVGYPLPDHGEMIEDSDGEWCKASEVESKLKNSINAADHNRILKEQDERYADRIESLESKLKEIQNELNNRDNSALLKLLNTQQILNSKN